MHFLIKHGLVIKSFLHMVDIRSNNWGLDPRNNGHLHFEHYKSHNSPLCPTNYVMISNHLFLLFCDPQRFVTVPCCPISCHCPSEAPHSCLAATGQALLSWTGEKVSLLGDGVLYNAIKQHIHYGWGLSLYGEEINQSVASVQVQGAKSSWINWHGLLKGGREKEMAKEGS